MTVVVVQSDDLAAWIGVAGVAVGVVLAAGVQLVRDAIQSRNDRKRELRFSSDTLLGAANALAVLVGIRKAPGARDEPALAWVEATNREAERVQTAAHNIQRHAAPKVGKAAGVVAATAFEVIDSRADVAALVKALDDFYDAGLEGGLRPILARPQVKKNP